jgi:hypothetical protein
MTFPWENHAASRNRYDAFENGSWKTKGTAVEYRPQDCTDDYPPI